MAQPKRTAGHCGPRLASATSSLGHFTRPFDSLESIGRTLKVRESSRFSGSVTFAKVDRGALMAYGLNFASTTVPERPVPRTVPSNRNSSNVWSSSANGALPGIKAERVVGKPVAKFDVEVGVTRDRRNSQFVDGKRRPFAGADDELLHNLRRA